MCVLVGKKRSECEEGEKKKVPLLLKHITTKHTGENNNKKKIQ